jgi:hypothetical protein
MLTRGWSLSHSVDVATNTALASQQEIRAANALHLIELKRCRRAEQHRAALTDAAAALAR